MATYTAIVCALLFVIVTLHYTHSATSSLQMSKIDAISSRNSEHADNKHSEQAEKQTSNKETDQASQEANDDDTESDVEDDGDGTEEDDDLVDSNGTVPDTEERNCSCDPNSCCMCCISLNLSFIDLGGPGCVKFNYLPNNDSVSVDMSYGQRLLHSNSIKRSATEATCMDLFSDLAQMCTKFTKIIRVQNGIKGCLTIEPVLLGVVQSSYNVGCFNMDEPGVQQISLEQELQSVENTTDRHETKPVVEETNEEEEEEELAAAISQSAEDGLAWFNTLISSVLGDDAANDTQSVQSPPATSVPLNISEKQ